MQGKEMPELQAMLPHAERCRETEDTVQSSVK